MVGVAAEGGEVAPGRRQQEEKEKGKRARRAWRHCGGGSLGGRSLGAPAVAELGKQLALVFAGGAGEEEVAAVAEAEEGVEPAQVEGETPPPTRRCRVREGPAEGSESAPSAPASAHQSRWVVQRLALLWRAEGEVAMVEEESR